MDTQTNPNIVMHNPEVAEKQVDSMLRQAGWVPIGGGSEIQKWETGTIVTGRFCGIRKGLMGFLIDIEDKNSEPLTYGCPTILKGKVESLKIGCAIRIQCLGKIETQRGDAWNFKVHSQDHLPAGF